MNNTKAFSRWEFNSPGRKICSMNSERKAKWNKLKFYYQMAFRHEPAEIIWKWFMLLNRSTKRNKKYSLRTIYDNCMFRLLLCCWNGQLFEWQQQLYMESLFRLRPPSPRHINFSSLRTPFIHFPSPLSTSILRHRDSSRDNSRTNGTATEAINSFRRSFRKAASVINNNYRTFLNRERLVNFHKFLIRLFCYQSVMELILVRGDRKIIFRIPRRKFIEAEERSKFAMEFMPFGSTH